MHLLDRLARILGFATPEGLMAKTAIAASLDRKTAG